MIAVAQPTELSHSFSFTFIVVAYSCLHSVTDMIKDAIIAVSIFHGALSMLLSLATYLFHATTIHGCYNEEQTDEESELADASSVHLAQGT